MSEGLSTRASKVLRRLESDEGDAYGWHWVGRMPNVGRKTIQELMGVKGLEFAGLPPNGSKEWHSPSWRTVRVRFRDERAVRAPVSAGGDDRVVVLLAEILAVLRDRL